MRRIMPTKLSAEKRTNEEIQALSEEMKKITRNLRNDAFLSVIQTADAIDRFLETRLRQTPASRTGLAILDALVMNNGRMRPVDIAKAVSRTKYTITRVISTLEKHGLVKKSNSIEFDGRVRKIAITQKGVDLISRTLGGRQQVAKEATSVLNKSELSQLTDLLEKLKSHLDSDLDRINMDLAMQRKRRNKVKASS
jgi:DNA-binding MarR family transcriptional regulator